MPFPAGEGEECSGLPEAGLLVGVLSEQGSGAPLWLVRVVTGVGSLEPR